MSLRVARYLRVSRIDQNPQLQADETADFIQRRGWELVGTYTDHGVSGSREKRPALDDLLRDARRKRFDLLVVYRSDRLFRSLKHMVMTLADLDVLGVGFVSVTEPFDTTTPSGRLLLHLVAAMAEFEKAILVERTRAGVAAARRRGAKLGRPRTKVDEAPHPPRPRPPPRPAPDEGGRSPPGRAAGLRPVAPGHRGRTRVVVRGRLAGGRASRV